jgi:hypothetical protein
MSPHEALQRIRNALNERGNRPLDKIKRIRGEAYYHCNPRMNGATGGKLFHHIYQIACIDSDTDEFATEALQAIDKLID